MAAATARMTSFFTGLRDELKQVAWPSREELIGSFLVVFVGVVFLAVYIGVWDFLLSRIAQSLLKSL